MHPYLLLQLQVRRRQVVQKTTVPKRVYVGLLQNWLKGYVDELFVRFVPLLESQNVLVVWCLLQSLFHLLAWLYLPGKLFGNVTNATDKTHCKLTFLKIPEEKVSDPPSMLVEPRLTLLQHLFSLIQPLLRFIFAILIKLKQHQGGVHPLMVIIQILILAGTCDRLKQFHTEMVDIVHILSPV